LQVIETVARSTAYRVTAMALAILFIVGCATQQSRRIGSELAQLEALVGKDGGVPVHHHVHEPVSPAELATGARQSPRVLGAMLALLEAKIQAQAAKSAGYPRLYLTPRILKSPYQTTLKNFGSFLAPLDLEWDVLSIWTNKYKELSAVNSVLARKYQLEVATREAVGRVLQAYLQYWATKYGAALKGIDQRKAEQDLGEGTAAFHLGQITGEQMGRLKTASQQGKVALEAADLDLEQMRTDVLVAGGFDGQARLEPPPNRAAVPALPWENEENCRRSSGYDRIDRVLLESARQALHAARLERWTKFATSVSVGGVDSWSLSVLNGMISWTLAIIDQGDHRRTVQMARVGLLKALVQRRSSLQSYSLAYRKALTRYRKSLLELTSYPEPTVDTPVSEGPAGTTTDVGTDGGTQRLEAAILWLRLLQARLSLFVLCGEDPATVLTGDE
jgi:outer membrane protein TolC